MITDGKLGIDWIGLTVRAQGVARTEPEIVDGLGVILYEETTVYDVCRDLDIASDLLGVSMSEWVDAGGGMFGYAHKAVLANGVSCMFGGNDGTVHIQATGSACGNIDTFGLLSAGLALGGKLSRLDLCWDIEDGGLLVEDYVGLYIDGKYSGRSRQRREVKSEGGGHTLYLGNQTSDRQLRIYDKGVETGTRGQGEWVRVELQLRDDAANQIARYIFDQVPVCPDVILSVIFAFIKFNVWDGAAATIGKIESDKGDRKTTEWALMAARTQARLMLLNGKFTETLIREFARSGALNELIAGLDRFRKGD